MFKKVLKFFTFRKSLNKKIVPTPTWKKIQRDPSKLTKPYGDCIDHGY